MAVPKKRKSSSRTGKRRSHLHLNLINVGFCSNCGLEKISHRICKACGFYKGKFYIKHDIVNANAKTPETVVAEEINDSIKQ